MFGTATSNDALRNELEAVGAKVEKLEAKVDALGEKLKVDALSEKLRMHTVKGALSEKVEAQLEAASKTVDALCEKVGALGEKCSRLEARVDALSQRVGAKLIALSEKFDELEVMTSTASQIGSLALDRTEQMCPVMLKLREALLMMTPEDKRLRQLPTSEAAEVAEAEADQPGWLPGKLEGQRPTEASSGAPASASPDGFWGMLGDARRAVAKTETEAKAYAFGEGAAVARGDTIEKGGVRAEIKQVEADPTADAAADKATDAALAPSTGPCATAKAKPVFFPPSASPDAAKTETEWDSSGAIRDQYPQGPSFPLGPHGELSAAEYDKEDGVKGDGEDEDEETQAAIEMSMASSFQLSATAANRGVAAVERLTRLHPKPTIEPHES